LRQAEEILRGHPDVESYSRQTGARLARSIAEPHTGDFLVKLSRVVDVVEEPGQLELGREDLQI
jgi:hypothetical protein